MAATFSGEHPHIAALVPMRHQSERVPHKNFRDFAGNPLYSYILSALSNVPQVDEIVVDTDSPTIMEGVEARFPHVRLIERPEHLRGGEVPMNDVLMHDVKTVEADAYLQTHSTNPLLRTETIADAIERFLEVHPSRDSLFSVTSVQTRFWDELARPVNHNPNILLRTQDLPPLYEENSCIYLFTRDILEERHNRIGRRPILFEIEEDEAIDIDEKLDFLIAELMYDQTRGSNAGPEDGEDSS
jgi:CMP-N-acetylneuraminic acid synthetase